MTDLAAEGDRLHAAALPATWAATTVNDCLGQGPFDENDDEWCVYDPEEDDPPLMGLGSMPREYAQWIAWSRTNWPAIAVALRERDEREHYAATRDERITELLRERDELRARKAEVWDLGTARIKEVVAERDALRVRAETAEADADRLAKILTPGYSREQRAEVLAAHAAAVEARHAD